MMTVAAAYQSREKVNIARRPKRSATDAKAIVPMNRPKNVAAANVAWSVNPNKPFVPVWNKPLRISPGLIEAVRLIS
jgi:hypothetical protein